MPTMIEAQRLSGVDRGKHVKFTSAGPRYLVYEGTLLQVKHLGDGWTTIVIRSADGRIEWDHVPPITHVTITGLPTPSGLNLHKSITIQEGP
ncbi:hypothetical protein [Glutamicibacter sp. MCAF14]|uniref:hypothetical protein n=1 Tax=Glutamicibacter sp. MCAF14 TaxID=3233043 RepID=UPI003F927259